MSFYDLPKSEREALVNTMEITLVSELEVGSTEALLNYCSDNDTYIRKAAYIIIGRLFQKNVSLQNIILNSLKALFTNDDFKVRQTVINAAGEIGKFDFQIVQQYFDIGLFDEHHSPRNAVIGSIKKMGEVNPIPVLEWAKQYLNHNGWPIGMQTALLRCISKVPIRFFIIDDSGSMVTNDGHMMTGVGSKTRFVKCARWNELTQAMKFHVGLAKAAQAPSEFRLLNGCPPVRIGFGDTNEDAEYNKIMNAIEGIIIL
jgi:hypothetical protein